MLPSPNQINNDSNPTQDSLNLFPDQLDDLIHLNPITCQHVLSLLPNPVSFNPIPLIQNQLIPPDPLQIPLRKRSDRSPPSSTLQSDKKKLKTSPHFTTSEISSPTCLSRQPIHPSQVHTPAGLLFVSLQLQTDNPFSKIESSTTTPSPQEPNGPPLLPFPHPSPSPHSDPLPSTPPAVHQTCLSTHLQPPEPVPVSQLIPLPSPAPFDQPVPQPIQSHSPTSPTADRHSQQLPSPPPLQIPGLPCSPVPHQSQLEPHMSLSSSCPPLPPSPLLPNQPISPSSSASSTPNECLSHTPSNHPPSALSPSSDDLLSPPPTSRSRISSLPTLSSCPEIVASSSVPLSPQRLRATSLSSAEHAPPPPLGPLQGLPPPSLSHLPVPQPDSLEGFLPPPLPPPLPSLRVAHPADPASTDPPTKLLRFLPRNPALPTPSSNHVQPSVTDENTNAHQPGHDRRPNRPVSPVKAAWTPKPGASPPKRYMFSSPLKAIQPSLAGAKAVVRKVGESDGEQIPSPVKTTEHSIRLSPSKSTFTSPMSRTAEMSVKSPSKLSRILPSSLQPGRLTGGAQPAKVTDQPLLIGAPSSESTKLNNLSKRLQALKSSSARMRVVAGVSNAISGECAPRRAFEEPGTRPRARRVTGGVASAVGERREEGLFRALTAESEQSKLTQTTDRHTTRNKLRFCPIRVEVVEMGCERPGSPEARFRKGAKNKQKKRATQEEEQKMEDEWEDEELEIKLDSGKEEGRRRKVQWKDRVVGGDEESGEVGRPTENRTNLKGILKRRTDKVDEDGNLIEPLPATIVPELVKVSRRIWND